ncbi:MAG: nucleotidyltransferase family protein [Oscillochloris sp.]|nr:nucleotidyltransferase family protein [Oscillochloris sp.]
MRDIVVLYADRTFDAATTSLPPTEVNPFSAEQQFLLDTARREVTPAAAERIRAALAGSLDWPYLLNMAEHHRLIPLLSRSLRDTCPDLLPPEVLGAINARAEEITRRTLVLTMELLRLLAELEQSGISALPLKGPALALQAYGDLALRSFGDLDILIHQRDLAVASAALCRLGYVAEHVLDTPRKLADYPRHCHDYKLYRHDLKLLVELQWRVIQFPFMFPADVDGWWSQLGTMRIGGMQVRCMDHASLLLVLCVHGSKHLWERLNWICDIAELVRSSPDLDWAQLLGQAQLHGAERMLLLGLALANRLLELPIPALIQGRIAADASHIEPLIAEVLQVLFPNREQEDDLALRRPLFYLRMRERLRDQVWVCFRHARSLLDPLRVLRT